MAISSIPSELSLASSLSTQTAARAAPTPAALAADADASVAPTAQSAETPTQEQLEGALKEIQEAMGPAARDVLFSIDEDSGRTVVKVIDSATQELIRQIPSKEAMDIARSLDHMQGLLLKQKA